MALKVLQGNLNRSRLADDLLTQLAMETRADVVLASEQYRNRDCSGWLSDTLGTSAIWVVDPRKLRVGCHGAAEGHVWVSGGGLTCVSVYLSPNVSMATFRERLSALEDTIRDKPGKLVVAGDFNARACEWGMPRPDSRGKLVVEMASRLGLVVMNTGSTPTYRRPGYGDSIPDITLVSEDLVAQATGWRVISDFTGSDHSYITFQIGGGNRCRPPTARRPLRWNTAKMDEEKLANHLRGGIGGATPTPEGPTDRDGAEALAKSTIRLIQRACDAAMPRRGPGRGRPEAYWWSQEIADLRREALRWRRRAQRTRNRPEAADSAARYKAAKKALGRAIQQAKARCWRELCDDLNRDPWGQAYKLVTRKLGGASASQGVDAITMHRIVDELFPTHPVRRDERAPGAGEEPPMFTAEELSAAVKAMKTRKAPGPDGIPSEALMVVAERCPRLLLRMYNACLTAGVFPAQWKVARLALISKGKGPPDSPSSYRPLCLLDTAGKLMERLMKPRLLGAVSAAGDLSESQYGFRKGRSTVNAISRVIEAVARANTACHAARPVVLLVTLDVRNAFNTARWTDMLEALRRFQVPGYLLALLGDYLKDRWLLYEAEGRTYKRLISAGAAQGSVLGPDLWNISYDSLLSMSMPDGAFLVGYADDVAAVITARSTDLAQLKLNQVMWRVGRWMRDHALQLAISKTEIVVLTRRRVPTIVPLVIGDDVVETKPSARYLGVTLDSKLTFGDHTRRVAAKAAKVAASLGRLMANVGGPKPCKRRLICTAAQSVMLYGSEIWADALRTRKHRSCMASVQRQCALRVACSYRTVSELAVLAVAGVIPIDLLALERKAIFLRSSEVGRAEAVSHARAQTLRLWQERWDRGEAGRWTHRLIRDLTPWTERSHGEVDFYLTQFLTGHGYFRSYLFRMGKVRSQGCLYCGAVRDDVEHTFFACGRFALEKELLAALVGDITPDNVVGVMLQGQRQWEAVAAHVERVLRIKRREGCLEDIPDGPPPHRTGTDQGGREA